jgi:hypothetical protein
MEPTFGKLWDVDLVEPVVKHWWILDEVDP